MFFIQSLLGKWHWHFAVEKDALWRSGGYETIRYDNEWGWLSSKPAVGVYGVCLWKHIRKGWETFSGFIRYEVGFGINVHFWQDWLCGERYLKEVFIS